MRTPGSSAVPDLVAGLEWTRHDGLDAIRALRGPWRDVAAAQGESRPYGGPGFVLAALRAYHGEDRPSVVVVRDGAGWHAVLPLVRRPLVRLGLTVEEYGLPFNPNTILSDPLIAAGPAAERRAVAARLIEGAFAAGADTVIADNLPAGAGLPELLREAAAALGLRSDPVQPARTLHFATLAGDWDGYLATRSRDHRWQLGKTRRKAGQVAVERHAGREAIRRQLDIWFAIERRSWQGAEPAAAMTDRDRAFHALLLDELAEEELGDLWIVRLGGAPAAALRMLAAPGRVSVHTMHYDQAYRAQAPGLIAFEAMMRDACDRGLAEVDMHGNTEFFRRWATGARAHGSVRLYRAGPRGALLQRARQLARAVGGRDRPAADAAPQATLARGMDYGFLRTWRRHVAI